MAVEIHILSGARQGERITFDAHEFRAGDDPGCEVFFDPVRDPSARHRTAVFKLKDDGWSVKPTGGGEMLLNQSPLEKQAHVRSGDVVRMSEQGPDFCFTIIGRVPAVSTSSPPPVPDSAPAPAAVAASAARDESPPQLQTGLPPIPKASSRQLPLWIGGGVAVAALILVWVWSVASNRPEPQSNATLAKAPSEDTDQPGGDTTPPSRQQEVKRPPATPQADDQETVKSTPPEAARPPDKKPHQPNADQPQNPDPPDVNLPTRLQNVVLLIQVEKRTAGRSFSWPFATCCAIGKNTLLTSARETTEMARLHGEGFKIWATDPARGVKQEVTDFRVHKDYPKLAQQPGDWILVNLGLLTVEGDLPEIAALAPAEELDNLEEGLPVACFGFTFGPEKTTRFDTFQPQLTPTKVYLFTPLSDLPGRSDLLEVKAQMPINCYGSPIVDMQGKVVAVYGEAAVGAGVKDLQYATVLNRPLLAQWLQDRDQETWIRPPAAENGSHPQDLP